MKKVVSVIGLVLSFLIIGYAVYLLIVNHGKINRDKIRINYENVINEIQGIRRDLVDNLQKERDKAVERARKLLVENKDLKDFLRDRGLIDQYGQVIDNE